MRKVLPDSWLSWYHSYKNTTLKIGPWVLSSFGNPPDFMKSAEFMKSGRFHGHEIWRISWPGAIRQISWTWNLVDFMKSGGFHGIWRISWQGLIYTAYWLIHVYLYWFWWKIQDLVVDTAYLACNRLIHVYLYWFWWKIQDLVVDHEI